MRLVISLLGRYLNDAYLAVRIVLEYQRFLGYKSKSTLGDLRYKHGRGPWRSVGLFPSILACGVPGSEGRLATPLNGC